MGFIFTLDGDQFKLQEGETVLDALERNGYEIEYQCRSGFCGSCRTKKSSGEVRYLCEPLAFINVHEVLPCCCVVAPNQNLTLEVRKSTTKASVQEEIFVLQESFDFEE